MTPAPQRHPWCDTCNHNKPKPRGGRIGRFPWCEISEWFLDACTMDGIGKDFVSKVGCMSHSSRPASSLSPEGLKIICENVAKEAAAQAREKVLDKAICLIREREINSENPKGWLWRNESLVALLESLRGDP